MNLRTLKKLSKRAAALLPAMGDDRQQFRAEPYDNYGLGAAIKDRKHWERRRCYAGYEPRNGWLDPAMHEVKYVSRTGHTVLMSPPSCPRKGTIMVGAVSGYYEPEWDEETAWSSFCDLLYAHFTDWAAEAEDEPAALLRPLDTVTEKFAAATVMIAELSASRAALAQTGEA